MSEMAWLLRLVRFRAHHGLIFHPLSPGVTQKQLATQQYCPCVCTQAPLFPHAQSRGCDNSLSFSVSSSSSAALVYQFWDWHSNDFLLEGGRLSYSISFPPVFRVRVVSEAQGDPPKCHHFKRLAGQDASSLLCKVGTTLGEGTRQVTWRKAESLGQSYYSQWLSV